MFGNDKVVLLVAYFKSLGSCISGHVLEIIRSFNSGLGLEIIRSIFIICIFFFISSGGIYFSPVDSTPPERGQFLTVNFLDS